MKVTRRSLGRMLAATAVARQVVRAQAPSREDDLKSARDQMQSNLQQIAKVKLPMAVEPAFHFKA